MCGIAGRIGLTDPSHLVIESMTRAMEHRGPDDVGFYFDNGVQLAMSRLAIIGIQNGKQPLSNETGSIQVVCNGEIYNYQELGLALRRQGHTLKTDSDVEVISHLYEEHGLDFVKHLRGMFAIALWDSSIRQLVLVRDRLGKKPLLYSPSANGGIQFASEMKAMLKCVDNREVDLSAIDSTLALGYPLTPFTGFKGVFSLPPAHMLILQESKFFVKEYWNLADQEPLDCSFNEAVDLLEIELLEATKLRLISERPIGALLSGGVDSSIVTAMMAKMSPNKIKTFSVGFSESSFDESHHARRVAEHLGTEHHEITVKPDPRLLIDRISKISDMPFTDSSLIPTFLVSELAKREVTVALTGDGGDEAFGGYLRYRALPFLSKMNPLLLWASPVQKGFEHIGDRLDSNKLKRISRNLQHHPSQSSKYFSMMSWLSPHDRQSLWTRTARAEFENDSIEHQFEALWLGSKMKSLSATAMRMDTRSYLLGDLNFKVDMASMANSLEIRSPLMDQHVYELAARLPIKFHIQGNLSKRLLKELLSRYVPPELTDRPKMGFGIPRASWLRNELGPLMDEILLGKRFKSRGWFDGNRVQDLILRHKNGHDVDQILWPLMMVELWAQTWLD